MKKTNLKQYVIHWKGNICRRLTKIDFVMQNII